MKKQVWEIRVTKYSFLNMFALVVLAAIAVSSVADPEQAPVPRTVVSLIPDGYRTVETAVKARFTAGAARPELAGYLGISVKRDDKGQVAVEEVQQPDSPGARAGVKKGDIVLQLDEYPIRSVPAFREWLQTYAPGKTLKLGLMRDGKPISATVTLIATSRPIRSGTGGVYLGLELGDSSEDGGVFVERVSPDSPAATAGLKNGDRVVKLDGKELAKADILNEVLSKKKAGDTITFTVRRDNKELPEVKATLAGERTGGGGGRPGFREPPLTLWTKEMLRLAVIPIEFSDVKHNPKITTRELEYALLSRGIYTEKSATGQPVHGSLHDWVREQSNGKLLLDDGKVFNWVEVSKKRGDYIQGSGTAGSNRTAVLTEALDKIIARDGADALKGFDAISFIYAGDRFRTNAGAIYYPHAASITHPRAGRFPYFLGVEGGQTMTPIGGFAKPLCQMLALPDLAARTENAGSEGLGKWCLLSDHYPNGGGGFGGGGGFPATSRPTHLGAWAKEKLGWITPAVIDPAVKQKLVLAPIEDSPNECFKLLVRPDGSEYFLLEVRKKKGFDAELPGEGLLIWRVVNGRPILEESHGIEGPAGPTSQLVAVPYPSAANNAFTPDTIPSSRSPLGGGFSVHITEIRRLADGKIAFQIGYEYR
jgi:M6 family metalloprotease-like protein